MQKMFCKRFLWHAIQDAFLDDTVQIMPQSVQRFWFLCLGWVDAIRSTHFIVSSGFTQAQGLQFQKCLMKLQVALEDAFIEIGKLADSHQDVVILIDRGLMDGSAYVSRTQWQAL